MIHRRLVASMAALAMLVLLLAGPATPQEKPPKGDDGVSLDKLAEMLKEGEPAFTAEQAENAVKDLVPLVEEVSGGKFKEVPPVKLVDRTACAAALKRDLIPQLTNLNPGMAGDLVAKSARSSARTLAMFLLGKYAFEDRELLLLPGNFEPLFKLTKTDMKHMEPILKLIVAHELTHALQFQLADVGGKLNSLKSNEEINALSAAIEGHATFVQDEIGKRLGLDASVMELSRMMAAGSVKIDDPALNMINELTARQYEQIYLGGKKFIEFHFKKSGNEGLWKILREPPVTTAMIANPATYSPKREGAQIDYAKVFDGLEKDFGDKKWTVKNIELGHMGLQAVYAAMPEKDREEILANIEHAQAFVANLDASTIGNVSIFVLKDGKLGPKMITALEELARNNVKKMKGGMLEFSDLTIEDFTCIKADAARKLSFSVTPPGGEAVQQAFYRIVCGNVLVELFDCNIELTNEKIGTIAEKVFKRYAEASGAGK